VKSRILAEHGADPRRHEHRTVRVGRVAEQAELVHVRVPGEDRPDRVGVLADHAEEALGLGCRPHRLHGATAGTMLERGPGIPARWDVHEQPDLLAAAAGLGQPSGEPVHGGEARITRGIRRARLVVAGREEDRVEKDHAQARERPVRQLVAEALVPLTRKRSGVPCAQQRLCGGLALGQKPSVGRQPVVAAEIVIVAQSQEHVPVGKARHDLGGKKLDRLDDERVVGSLAGLRSGGHELGPKAVRQ